MQKTIMFRQHVRRVRICHRGAFTLVELLVVITIIAILVALLLPAIQAARKAARRVECKNHLKQLGLASLRFHDTYQFFPVGGTMSGADFEQHITDGRPNGPLRQGLGWAFQILPFLEEHGIQSVAASRGDNSGPIHGSGTRHATATLQDHRVPAYNCPSRRGPTRWIFHAHGTGVAPWLTDYAGTVAGPARNEDPTNFDAYLATPASENDLLFWGCNGCRQTQLPLSQITAAMQQPLGLKFRGIIQRCDWESYLGVHLGYTQKISFPQISDGASNTMLIAEKRLRTSKYQNGAWHDDRGMTDGYSTNTIRSTAFPLKQDADESDTDRTTDELPYSFGSAHPGGMNAVFADGSVRTLNYDTDRQLFNRLGHRSDGEPLDREQL